MNRAKPRLLLVAFSVLIQAASVHAFTAGPDASLVGWWKFDEVSGTAAADSSGNGNKGTIVGTPGWVPGGGKFGGALQFNGTDCYVNVGQGASLKITSGVTMCYWIKTPGFGSTSWAGIIGNGDGAWRMSRSASTGNALHMGVGGATVSGNAYFDGSKTVTDNEWHHGAGVFDGTHATIYVDGVQDVQISATGQLASSTYDVVIGTNAQYLTSRLFTGMLDDVRIYNRGLTVDELKIVMSGFAGKVASNPYPADKATDVLRDVVMTWVPPFACKHNVYFGTNFSDVNSATISSPLCVSKNQDANSYDPTPTGGLLEFGKTYYWRVDEVNTTENKTYQGDTWTFTAEPVSYPVTAKIIATASASRTAAEDPCNTVNGSGLTGDLHNVNNKAMWVTPKVSLGGKLPQWIKYEFDKVYKLDQMWVWNYNVSNEDSLGYGAKDVTIDYSVDGGNWAPLGNFEFADGDTSDTYAHNTEVPFKGIAAKFVRLTITSSWMSPAITGLSEVRFYHIPVWAREPKPATGATGIDPTRAKLSWRPGREAVTHNVLIGTDPNALTAAGSSATPSFTPTMLGFGTKYYWRVDEVNAATSPSLWTGDAWDFTTPNFRMIDDMESYTDVKGQAIFNVWVDGYGSTSNGGLIGYDPPAACMEKTIKNSGSQSAPFRYGQNSAPISEASLSFTTPQDWTIAKADTLRIWVQGRTDNLPTAATLPPATTSFDISAAGTDIYTGSDQFRFVYRTLTGDGSITARVDLQQPTNQYAKAAVMMRTNLNTGSMQAYVGTVPGTPNTTATPKQVEWAYRGSDANTAVTSIQYTPAAPSTWVRLTRKGNVFTGEYSSDGTTWISTGFTTTPQTIAMGSPVYIGLAVCSHVAGTLGLVKFSNVQTTGSVSGDWTKADVNWTFDTTTVLNTADTLYVTVQDNATSKTVIPALSIPATSVGAWQAVDIPFSQFTGVKMNSVMKLTIGVGDKNRSTNPGPGQIFIDDIGVGHPAQ
jgi:hypothetical protein